MAQHLTIVMAQLNFLVGDIEGNTDLVIENAERAIDENSADLIVFPELTLTGYPPEDLLLRPSLQLRIDKAIAKILDASLDIHLVVGYPLLKNGVLYNALSVFKGNESLATYFKQCLPNYQVFDERRYFAPGDEVCLLNILGVSCAFTICEDLWEPEPIQQAKDAGAQFVININASPFHINKLSERKTLLKERCLQGEFPILYVNLIGGQDELVFDGGSMVISADGECNYLAPNYVEGMFAVKVNVRNGECEVPKQEIATELSLEASVYQSLVLGVKDYVNKNKFKGVVLGLSGGIDSALTLAVAVDALGSDRVEAVMMPFEYTSELSLEMAGQQAEMLGVNYQIIEINSIYKSFISALENEFAGTEVDVSEQNLQARARGVLLMAISNKKGSLVLTTGNKSEIAVGYSTLYGDMAGGFDVLKDVSKTLVYKLAKYRNCEYMGERKEIIPEKVIHRPPSAELAPGQVDQDSLPDYALLDQILELYIEKDLSADAIISLGFNEEEVRRVLRLVDLNEYKRRQSPVGVRLTERGFGRDRRYPITNAWPIGD